MTLIARLRAAFRRPDPIEPTDVRTQIREVVLP